MGNPATRKNSWPRKTRTFEAEFANKYEKSRPATSRGLFVPTNTAGEPYVGSTSREARIRQKLPFRKLIGRLVSPVGWPSPSLRAQTSQDLGKKRNVVEPVLHYLKKTSILYSLPIIVLTSQGSPSEISISPRTSTTSSASGTRIRGACNTEKYRLSKTGGAYE